MKRFKPTLWLSFGIVALTLALALAANALGLLPDGRQAELESRAKVAEALAVQLAGAANRNDQTTLEETMASVVERNPDVYSAALRRFDGEIIAVSGDHDKFWVELIDGKSTPQHVSVPLVNANGTQGTIEISFAELSSGSLFLGMSSNLLTYLGFLTLTGFIGYFYLLRRTLNELDPGKVIPERVQKAFDTLSEGVLILDEKERILLANSAFINMYGLEGGPKIGSKINNLPWRMVDGSAQAGGYPWHTALRENRETREDILSLRNVGGDIHNFKVNATVISNEKDRKIGAIVTLADTTKLKLTHEDLEKTAEKLKKSQDEIARQRREMDFLSNHDQLSGCLNKRAFIRRLSSDIETAWDLESTVWVMTVNVDGSEHFADDLGPALEDKLIVSMAECLSEKLGNPHYVARQHGTHFKVTLLGLDGKRVQEIARCLHRSLSQPKSFLPEGFDLSVSIGLAGLGSDGCTAEELVYRSAQAQRASEVSENKIITTWTEQLATVEPKRFQTANSPSGPGSAKPVTGRPQPAQPIDRSPIQKPLTSDEAIQSAALVANESFYNKVDQSVSRARQENKPFAILHLSISSWDYLVEALGEALCLKLARQVKDRVEPLLRENDTVILLGNDGELLIELSDIEESEDAEWVVNRMLRALKVTIEIGGQKLNVACKFGIAVFPQHGQDASTLIRNAKVAMRRAQLDNKLDGFKYYSPDMTQDSRQRLDIELGIRSALQNDEFELFFQPIVDAKTGQLAAAEALLRCNNSKLRKVSMDKVIGVAEQSDLSVGIDLWVLRQALKQMHKWCDSGLSLPKISINISAMQLTNVDFMDKIFDNLRAVRFSASRVQIEVTETARLKDVEIAASQLKRLQQLGVQIALDDFGTGQASLTYLQRLHPDVIKIDRSFVTGVTTNHANATLVSAMTVMAHCLGLKVVVEGVEDEEQLEFLRETRCDEIQGYLISKPMPADVMTDWMDFFVRDRGVHSYIADMQPVSQLETSEASNGRAA